MAINNLIQFRRGTSSQWNNAPGLLGHGILYNGELGFDTTTKKFKIGDGLTHWASGLPYAAIVPTGFLAQSGIGLNLGQDGSDLTISITGIYSTQMIDFNSAVDARVSAASVSEEQVQDIIASGDHISTGFLRNGTGIVLDYDDNNNFITINVSGFSLSNHHHDDRYYTETELNTSGSGGQVHWGNITNSPTGFTPVSHTHPSIEISDFTEAVQDVVGTNAGTTGFLRNGTGVLWTYDDSSNTLSVNVTGIPSSLISDLSEAIGDEVDTILSAGTGISLDYNDGTDTLTINTSGLAYSVHTHLWSGVTDASSKATLNELAYLSGVVAGTASSDRAVVLDSNKDITGIGSITTTGNIIVGGDLTVQGTTTTVNSTTVDIGDNIIRVNVSGSETQGGLEVYDHDNTASRSIVWDIVDDRWEFAGGDVYTTGNFISNNIQVSSSSLVTNLNADLLDGQHGSYYRDFVNLTGLPDPIITGTLTGDVTGSSSVTLTDLGNGTLSISTTLADNSVTSAKIVNGTIVNEDINDTAAIAVTKLASSGVTLGSTVVNLGQTSTVIDGLTRISGVSAGNPTYIYYAVIDGGSP